MRTAKLLQIIGKVSVYVLVMSAGFGYYASNVRAEMSREVLVSLEFPPGPNRQAPKSTIGGGVRGKSCVSGTIPLTALMPNRENEATTIAPNPTLFVYVPDTEAKTAEFVIIDDQGRELLSDVIVLSGQAGIVKINIPQSKQLETGKNYQWQFSLVCGTEAFIKGTSISGTIDRINLSTETNAKLAQTITPLEKAKIYASNNIWTETLNILADQRSIYPQEWQELLNSVGLGDFAQAPFVN